MNAFALHDVSDQAAVRRWGASAFAIVAAHAALIALAMNWYTQRPVPGVSLPAIMVDMAPVSSAPQSTQLDLAPGPVDAAGRCLAAGARGRGSRAGGDRADPAAGEAGGRRAAGAEGGNEAGDRARQAGPGSQADAGQAEGGPPGREEADRGAACAANDGLAQGRAPGAGRVRRQRRRIGRGARLLPADGRRAPAALQAIPAGRQVRGPAGHLAGQLHAQPERSACFPSASAARRAIRTGCRDAGDGAPRPAVSRVPCRRQAVLDAVQRAGGVLSCR